MLASLYYNPGSASGYSSQLKLWKAAKQKDPKISMSDVQKWWRKQNIPTRYLLAKKKFPRAVFVAGHANQIWCADMADISKLSEENQGYKWMLIVQDLFSRKLKALVAQKTKTSLETSRSLSEIFGKEKPHKFLTDQGGEFLGACVPVYQQFHVHHYTTQDVTQKAATCERALLDVKRRLYKIMAHEKTWRWIDKLQPALHAYNTSFNRNLGMEPNEAAKRKNQSKVFYNTVTKVENRRLSRSRKVEVQYKYSIGQIVRILLHQTFSKSYSGMCSDMLYEIYKREIRAGAVPVYYLKELLSGEEIKGSFYEQELVPVEINRSKLPKIDKIQGIRLSPHNKEQVLVGNRWVDYGQLIPYDNL